MVRDHGCRQDASLDDGHLARDFHSDIPEDLIVLVVQDLEAVLDCVGSGRGVLGRELDHVGSLNLVKLLLAALTGDHLADLHGQDDCLADLDAGQHGEAQGAVVGLLEVRDEVDLFLLGRASQADGCLWALEGLRFGRVLGQAHDLERAIRLFAVGGRDAHLLEDAFDLDPVQRRTCSTKII